MILTVHGSLLTLHCLDSDAGEVSGLIGRNLDQTISRYSILFDIFKCNIA
jgi:hypothetical protein